MCTAMALWIRLWLYCIISDAYRKCNRYFATAAPGVHPPEAVSQRPAQAYRPPLDVVALRLLLLATRDTHAGQGGGDKDDGKHNIAVLKGDDQGLLGQILA